MMARKEAEGQILDGNDLKIRVSLQRYIPGGDKRKGQYKEIPGTSIRIRFSNEKAVANFAGTLRKAIPDLL